jgi:hypothetical protein
VGEACSEKRERKHGGETKHHLYIVMKFCGLG